MNRVAAIFAVSWACCVVPGTAAPEGPAVARDLRFIANDHLKLGVDPGSGGAICWLGVAPDGPNLLNHHDRGRFIQQSYYGAADGSEWAGKPWRWNPVQGGHYLGLPAKVLEQRIEKDRLYVKSIPIHWAEERLLDNCRMEQWIRLNGMLAEIRFRFTYQGKEKHPPHHQEMPAVFVDAELRDLVIYQGDRPWTGAALKTLRPGWPNEYRDCPEEWAGFFGADGRGVAVAFPGTRRITCYRNPGPAGPEGGGCSYFAPIRTLAIIPGTVIDYRVYLTIGTAAESRQRFMKLRDTNPS